MKRLITALVGLEMLAACATQAPIAVDGKAVAAVSAAIEKEAAVLYATAEPPRDERFPARNRQVLVPSHGVGMNGLFFLAAGEGPKPTLLLLHGLPGNERNLDLAQAVRRAGWNVLAFTYRGAWGSPGTFSIQNAIDDAAAALAFLKTPEVAAKYNVDPARIVIAGHSMGGYAAAATAAREALARPAQPLAGVILLDAWDIAKSAAEMRAGGDRGRQAFIASFDDIGHALGPITAADIADELARRGDGWSLADLAPALATKPVLTVYATHGIAEDNRAVAGAIQRVSGARLTARELATDHSFADHRIALAAEVVKWLATFQPR